MSTFEIAALPLPVFVLLTDRFAARAAGRTLVATVAAALDAGARAVLFREKDLPQPDRLALAMGVRHVVRSSGARMGVASDPFLAVAVDTDWLHLAQRDPQPETATGITIGRSCHGPAEVGAAAAEGCAYATISPVALTISKPGYGPALGVNGVQASTRTAPGFPLWALGGVDAHNAPMWLAAGTAGIAVMGGVMGAPDPAAATRRLLCVLDGSDTPA